MHIELGRLKNLPRRQRFLARHAFPLHRHQRTSFLLVPSVDILEAALEETGRFDFVPPSGSYAVDLVANHDAFVALAAKDHCIRCLGKPRELADTMHIVCQPVAVLPPPPVGDKRMSPQPGLPVTVGPNPELRSGQLPPTLPLEATVQTEKGVRPLAGGFHRARARWAPFRQEVRPRTLAILQEGVKLHWNGPPPLPLWLHNQRMTAENELFVDEEIDVLLRTEAIYPYDCGHHGPPVCILPLKVTEDVSGKFRLVWDGRYTNSFLLQLHVKFESLDMLRLLLSTSDPDNPPLLLKVDLRAGYHHLLMAASTAPYLCFIWRGRLFFWRALPFGLSTAPATFEGVMRGLKAILRGPLRTQLMGYLDDLGIPIKDQEKMTIHELAERAMRVLQTTPPCPTPSPEPEAKLAALMYFGAYLNTDKLVYDTRVPMLGIMMDTVKQTTSVPERRRDVLLPELDLIAQLQPSERIPVRQLSRVAGSLVSMHDGLKHARTMLWSIFYTILPHSLAEQWYKRILVPDTVKSTCSWWSENFDRFNERPFVEPPHFCFEWDAARAGSGAVLYGQGQYHLLHADRPAAERDLHNDVWELCGGIELLIPCLPIIEGSRLAMAGDNTFAVAYLRRGGGSNPWATAMVQRTFQLLILYDAELISVNHLPGWLNVGPDAISRLVNYRGDWALKEDVWQSVYQWIHAHQLLPPTAEVFASALNHHLDHWCSRFREPGATWVNAFSETWTGEICWINPPFGMWMRTWFHVQAHAMRGYLVVPHWSEAPWWYLVWQEATHYFQLPPDAFTSVAKAHVEGYRDPGYPIYVVAIRVSDVVPGLSPPATRQFP